LKGKWVWWKLEEETKKNETVKGRGREEGS
jgi:hypothetical protein